MNDEKASATDHHLDDEHDLAFLERDRKRYAPKVSNMFQAARIFSRGDRRVAFLELSIFSPMSHVRI